MKKRMAFLWVMAALILLAACGKPIDGIPTEGEASRSTQAATGEGEGTQPLESEVSTLPAETQPEGTTQEEEPNMEKIQIVVGQNVFLATPEENAAAGALWELLPLTLNMQELNGNEKYFYLDSRLPTDASRPSGIRAGDLMLYGDSCLVLFYESFSTAYSYTPLGHVDDPEGLAAALGSGDVQVTFRRG